MYALVIQWLSSLEVDIAIRFPILNKAVNISRRAENA